MPKILGTAYKPPGAPLVVEAAAGLPPVTLSNFGSYIIVVGGIGFALLATWGLLFGKDRG